MNKIIASAFSHFFLSPLGSPSVAKPAPVRKPKTAGGMQMAKLADMVAIPTAEAAILQTEDSE
eukprot:CAMPEP_0185577556 /NCGR_PEP_ID=MMETSP0434-20130131/10424_1 /TAXON_ID=626734 ORGANISM="Favella taraikaensis, Strain Fe Narragansett Bay" /NCGR_SAMPLE_ID=MMETSP0434 /ASSEMBLY_ACC=CAM_ASM_000379 /LENGTH=62 /DNA_ID=CAMNT_0028195159 /DNA_START=509 /DNA_END=697 /DNA_ORIENTATION=+